MTALLVVLMAAATLVVAALLVPLARRLIRAGQAERQRRRRQLTVTLTEMQLQRLAHQAMAQLLDEARRSLAGPGGRR